MSPSTSRLAVVLVAAAVLLPAGVAHASLPLSGAGSGLTAPAASASDDDGTDEADDAAADDQVSADEDEDAASETEAGAEEDSAAADDEAEDDLTPSRFGAPKASSGSSSGRRSAAATPARPRGVDARLSAFDRAVVAFRPASTVRVARWIVTLRSGRTGRLMILGPKARSATFTALRPSTRYTATVTVIASGGKRSSASDHVRTGSLRKAVRQAQAEAARAASQAKAQRFG